MKRLTAGIILTILLLSLAAAGAEAITAACGRFVDENGDGVCDRCQFVDENGDGICDRLQDGSGRQNGAGRGRGRGCGRGRGLGRR